jgi:UDP-3-O-[3-hydroxymyristoyl] glucosamine N-acyltransferase
MSPVFGQHCTIFDDVEIGRGTRIGNFVLIRDKTIIGEECIIGSYVDIEGEARIGNSVSLQSGCYVTRGVIIEDYHAKPLHGLPVTSIDQRAIADRLNLVAKDSGAVTANRTRASRHRSQI